jgi:hypothetical protein
MSGAAPERRCDASTLGIRERVSLSADYVLFSN